MKPTSHEVEGVTEEKAILVSLVTDDLRWTAEMAKHSLNELINLAETAGLEVLGVITQNRETADSKWFIGKGKAEEVKQMVIQTGANIVVFDQELSGAQVRNLEELLDAKIIDRTQLILDIFAQRAKTREGILQVELAHLSYLLPRLSGQGKNLSRQGGGVGTRFGGGETKLETDRRHIRERISTLKRQLQEVVRLRNLHRERRKKTGVFQVALVGYTNAGKSTLLKQLTQADVYVENKLFATLDPTSRNLTLPGGKEIVVTDTVGFIQNLPHDLIAAFRATLEEANEADLILHVVDSSSEMRDEQMRVVGEVLRELGAHDKETVTLFNKVDRIDENERNLLTAPGEYLRLSALNEGDLEALQALLEHKLSGGVARFRIPADKGDLIALAYRIGTVQDSAVDEDDMVLSVRLDSADSQKFGGPLAPYRDGSPSAAPVSQTTSELE
ncbi:GTPase HflX [Gorillibacterium timonense]|uniref:GTPase HflX n=1 Tax=Gorillibacterium timonense TaxID=1689269 RepID=UPI00071C6526|nr:GTPase HflX [Gorillibacterium timonense]